MKLQKTITKRVGKQKKIQFLFFFFLMLKLRRTCLGQRCIDHPNAICLVSRCCRCRNLCHRMQAQRICLVQYQVKVVDLIEIHIAWFHQKLGLHRKY